MLASFSGCCGLCPLHVLPDLLSLWLLLHRAVCSLSSEMLDTTCLIKHPEAQCYPTKASQDFSVCSTEYPASPVPAATGSGTGGCPGNHMKPKQLEMIALNSVMRLLIRFTTTSQWRKALHCFSPLAGNSMFAACWESFWHMSFATFFYV